MSAPGDGGGPAVLAEDLLVRYERGAEAAVHGVSLRLERGAGLLVLGPPGSGKTSLLRGLLGLAPTVGNALVLGRPPGDRSALARIGWAPADLPVPGGLTVRQVVTLVTRLRRVPAPESAADALMDRMAISAPGAFAERIEIEDARRLTLACALAGDPDLLVLDDPWEFPETRAEIRAALARGASVLAAAHEPGGLVELLGASAELPSVGEEVEA